MLSHKRKQWQYFPYGTEASKRDISYPIKTELCPRGLEKGFQKSGVEIEGMIIEFCISIESYRLDSFGIRRGHKDHWMATLLMRMVGKVIFIGTIVMSFFITVAIEIILDYKVEKRIPVIDFVILIVGNKS